MKAKKSYVTFKINFDSGMPHNVKVHESREYAAQELESLIKEEIETEIADYGEVDAEWKEDMLSQVNRVKQGMTNIVSDTLKNEAYYLMVAEN